MPIIYRFFSSLFFISFAIISSSQDLEVNLNELIKSKTHSPIHSICSEIISLRVFSPYYTLNGYQFMQEEWIEDLNYTRSTKEIQGLEPATLYHISIAIETATRKKDTLWNIPFITRSASSGEILVYFNSSINEEVSNGAAPVSTSGTAFRNALIQKIEEATISVDVAAYNINRQEIVQALNDAANRGIRVRYIAEGENANTALNTSLAFPVLKRNDNDGIMHHKFVIIDASEEMESWIISGSTNLTSQQIATDNNNAVFIQDQSLAMVYEMEFEEMWGSSGPQPNTSQSRFGQFKIDNTPHWLMVGDIPVEIYFSPSDNTSFHISNALLEAEESISLALLLFTFNPLANTVIQKHHQGLNVRGLINEIDASGSRFQALLNNGVNVHPNAVPNVQLHHKYAIIDAEPTANNPKVITGSHNWTNRAENHNDENTLIIHDPDIANIFRQEFEARWCESVLNDCFVSNLTDYQQISAEIWYTYPNPTTDFIFLEKKQVESTFGRLTFSLFNSSGQIVKSGLKNNIGNEQFRLNLSHFPSGSYYLKIQENDFSQLLQITVIRQ